MFYLSPTALIQFLVIGLLIASVAVADTKFATCTPEKKAMTDLNVYDKAAWHQHGDYPTTLPQENAFNHIGFFLAWMIEQGLLSGQFKNDFSLELKSFSDKKLTGPKFLQELDGVIDSGMFSAEGNAFASYYYDDHYLDDYEDAFPIIDSLYEVKDTTDNFNLIRAKITMAYEQWKSARKE